MSDIKNEIKAAVEAVERELTEKEIGEQRQIKRKKLEELRAMGIELTDLPGGVVWKRI